MKTIRLSHFLYVMAALMLVSFSDPYTIKRITDANFKYEFYTTDKLVTAQKNKIYYWFKGGAIHYTESGMAGQLLNGDYLKMYHGNQLAEQGQFTNGLKTGVWKTWHQNGTLETRQYWSDGFRKDYFYRYDATGKLVERGDYRRDKKHGLWIDYLKRDTITYKNGEVFVKKPKLTKEEKAKAKKEKALKASQKKEAKKAAAKQKSAKQKPKKGDAVKANPEKKDNFFKRLFRKKPKQPSDDQGE